ncbi:hypothetical protein MJG53_009192 [Ovis ammon polii x Ovis aries]|uniref:Uncharacterized protein n=1 Tax=Ovis ammon polii x Ovis aries TaxID=2918886 RepID=A0ACB9UYT9_9CETA|nr:hypothetical protein MJG53_009192 [Ovis ammon polii x Ovis aries]
MKLGLPVAQTAASYGPGGLTSICRDLSPDFLNPSPPTGGDSRCGQSGGGQGGGCQPHCRTVVPGTLGKVACSSPRLSPPTPALARGNPGSSPVASEGGAAARDAAWREQRPAQLCLSAAPDSQGRPRRALSPRASGDTAPSPVTLPAALKDCPDFSANLLAVTAQGHPHTCFPIGSVLHVKPSLNISKFNLKGCCNKVSRFWDELLNPVLQATSHVFSQTVDLSVQEDVFKFARSAVCPTAKDHPKQIIAYGKHHTQRPSPDTGLERQPFLPSQVHCFSEASKNLSCGPSEQLPSPKDSVGVDHDGREGGAVSAHASFVIRICKPTLKADKAVPLG